MVLLLNSDDRDEDSLNAEGKFKVTALSFILLPRALPFISLHRRDWHWFWFNQIYGQHLRTLERPLKAKGERDFSPCRRNAKYFHYGKRRKERMNFNFDEFRRFISSAFAFYALLEDFLCRKNIHLTQTTINHAMHINVALSSLNRFSLMWVERNGMTGGICA